MVNTALVADGDATTLELITAVLTRDGLTVIATPDGGDALARFHDRAPALVICAESLPGISGSELCRQIKAQRPEVRVVILHPRASGIDALGLVGELGCDAVLALPFRYGELKRLLQQWQVLPGGDPPSSGPADAEFHLPPPAIFALPPPLAPPVEPTSLAAAAPLAAGPGADVAGLPLPIPLPSVIAPVLPDEPLPEPEAESALPELVAEEVVTEPAAGAAPALELPPAGELSQLPLPRLLYRLYLATFSGTLELTHGAATRSLTLWGGLPVYVDSANVDETLGRLLLEHGRITFEQYNASLAQMHQTGCRQGEALVRLGAISEVELVAALRQQTEQKVINSFAWREGSYRLTPGAELPPGQHTGEVQPLPAIWRGVHEHYDLDSLLTFFVEHQAHYLVATELFAVYYPTLGPLVRDLDLVRLLNGATTFAQALQSETRALPLAQALYVLLATDMIRPAPAPGEPVKLPSAASVNRRATLDQPALARLSEELRREHRRVRDSDYLDALRVDVSATTEEVDAAYANIVRALQLEALPAGLAADVAPLARELHELLARARRVVRDPALRDRYLLEQQQQFTGAEEAPAPDRDEPSGPPPVPTLDLASGVGRTTSVEAQQAYLKGQGLLRAGQADKAAERFQAAIAAAPREPSYRVALAQALLHGAPNPAARARAVTCLQQALQLDSAHVEANFEIAKLLHSSGHRDRAYAYVQRVLQREPTHQGARRLLAALG